MALEQGESGDLGAGGTRRQILRSSLSDPIWGVTRQDELN